MTSLSRLGFFAMLIFSLVSALLSKTVHNAQNHWAESSKGAILGRPIQIPARDYRETFKVEAPKLGDCALKMQEGKIKTCTGKFGGNEAFIPKASTNIDVSKIQNSFDVITHGMGDVGSNIGILGVVGVGLKTKMAITTPTSNKDLTLMSSYELQKGILTLQHAHPLTEISQDGELYLSEIVIGGNEILAVSMEFENVQKKVEVENTLKVKIFFATISEKMRYIQENFQSVTKTRVQYRSSWRPHLDSTYTSLEKAIQEVERIEKLYAEGPTELKNMDINDTRGHNTYYFVAWNKSPLGVGMNMVVAQNDLSLLIQQDIELQAVMNKISELVRLPWELTILSEIKGLNDDVKRIHEQLNKGIESYHKLSSNEIAKLKTAYGENKAPDYYTRQLKRIVGY